MLEAVEQELRQIAADEMARSNAGDTANQPNGNQAKGDSKGKDKGKGKGEGKGKAADGKGNPNPKATSKAKVKNWQCVQILA